jgi:predicted DNA-binding transcriptional regulator AlpA
MCCAVITVRRIFKDPKMTQINSTNEQKAHPPTDALLWTMPTLTRRIGLSRSNIYQQIQSGKFPEPVKIGRSSRWLAAEIQAWVTAQANTRSPKTTG